MICKLVATFPDDRTKPGVAMLVTEVDEEILAGPWEVYGKADNKSAIGARNPTRDPLKRYGDHPLGLYQCGKPITMTALERRSYGPTFVPLRALAGDARRSERPGLGLHGGALNEDGTMRPTRGCCRWRNEDLAEMLSIWENLRESPEDVLIYEARAESAERSTDGTEAPTDEG